MSIGYKDGTSYHHRINVRLTAANGYYQVASGVLSAIAPDAMHIFAVLNIN